MTSAAAIRNVRFHEPSAVRKQRSFADGLMGRDRRFERRFSRGLCKAPSAYEIRCEARHSPPSRTGVYANKGGSSLIEQRDARRF